MYIIHAKRARVALSGRVYNKRTVVASFYPEDKFNLQEYLVSIWCLFKLHVCIFISYAFQNSL